MAAIVVGGWVADATAAPQLTNCKRSALLAAFGQWLSAQRSGQLERYLAQYDPALFVGTKRTRSGAATEYRFEAWRQDRALLLASKPQVGAYRVIVRTAEDEPSLGESSAEIAFLQRWESKRYADHGPKLLRYACADKGRPRIVREEMMASLPGWSGDEATPPRIVDVSALVPPIAVAWKVEPVPVGSGRLQLLSLALTDKKGAVKTIAVTSTDVNGDAQTSSDPVDLPASPIVSVAFAESDFTDWFVVLPEAGGARVLNRAIGEGGADDTILIKLRTRRGAALHAGALIGDGAD